MPSSPPTGDTRERIITATHELFRRQGFNGTSLSQVVKASGATTGSLYHFFPGGKEELTAEVLRSSGAAYRELVELIMNAAVDPEAAMTDLVDGAAAVVLESGFIDPCPIGTVAREVASTHEALRKVAAEVMQSWIDVPLGAFVDGGIPEPRARQLATMAVATIEGGFLLARTTRDIENLVCLGEVLAQLVATEFDKLTD